MAHPSDALGTLNSQTQKVLAGKGKKLHVHEAHVRKTKNGGYIIRHDLRDKQGNPPMDGQRGEEEYSANSPEEMLAHMQQHLGGGAAPGGQDDEEEEEAPPQ